MPEFAITLDALHKGQQTVIDNARRVTIVECGRRWGKTILSRRLAVETMLEGGQVGLFGPQFQDIRQTWNAIVEAVKPLIKHKGLNEQMHTIDLVTGGHLKFWSLKDISKKDEGRGVDYDRVIYDEFQKIPSKVLRHNWLNAVNATLIRFGGDAWFFGTPPDSRSHYAYALFCMGAVNNPKLRAASDFEIPEDILKSPDPDFISFRATTYSNPLLPLSEIERMKRRLPTYVFEQEVMCRFVESGGNMFLTALQLPDVAQRVFSRSLQFRRDLPIVVSFDFNRSPMAAVLFQHMPNFSQIFAIKEFGAKEGEKVTTEYTCELIRQYLFEQTGQRMGISGNVRYPCTLPLTITGDATGRTVHGSQSDSLNYFQIIQNYLGLRDTNFAVKKANPPHASASLQMNQYLEKHTGIWVDPLGCPRLKNDMFSTKTTPDKKIDKKLHDPHFFDAFRYYFHTLLPVNYFELKLP